MAQHDELWRFTDHLNGPFNYVLTILYGILLLETSLLYFALIFSKMKFALKLFYSSMCLSFTFLCIVAGFLFSAFTSTMQTSFQDIRRFAGCDLKLEQKLKMGSSLHTIFSGLLNIKKVS
ncbi:uncharacterized protein LOC111616154 isoform X2 [Centruroides sculpturatus]|nr:uncharacterized protein LOC111616154 isoform X2 [Centruroides sculpturatus]